MGISDFVNRVFSTLGKVSLKLRVISSMDLISPRSVKTLIFTDRIRWTIRAIYYPKSSCSYIDMLYFM